MTSSNPTQVLFVCLGNICRSPTAHGVFESIVNERGLQESIHIDSCGTGDWHIGYAPDPRAVTEAAKRGYDLGELRARQVEPGDFGEFDYILAMDEKNLSDLKAMCPATFSGFLGLFLPFQTACDGRRKSPTLTTLAVMTGFTGVLAYGRGRKRRPAAGDSRCRY